MTYAKEGKTSMKKPRILFYNNFYSSGGVEVFLHNLSGYLAENGYDVTVAAAPRYKADFHHPFGPKVKSVWRPLLDPRYKRHSLPWILDHLRYRILESAVEAYLSLKGYDIVVASQEKWVMRNTTKLRGKKKFAWVHSEYSTRRPLHNNCFANAEEELNCMRHFKKVVCVSEVSRQGLIQTLGDPGNLIVKYNPINVKRIFDLAAVPCPITRNPNLPLLVSVGRLDPEKQYPLLLEACAALHKETPFELWIVGEGSDRPAMEAFMAREKTDYVRLLGAQANPYHYLAQADLFVSSSKTESYGLAVQEALILGVPVVAVQCLGIEEVFDSRFGTLVSNSVEDLRAGIEKYLRDKKLLNECRDNIARYYRTDDLYEKRLEAIRGMLEE